MEVESADDGPDLMVRLATPLHTASYLLGGPAIRASLSCLTLTALASATAVGGLVLAPPPNLSTQPNTD